MKPPNLLAACSLLYCGMCSTIVIRTVRQCFAHNYRCCLSVTGAAARSQLFSIAKKSGGRNNNNNNNDSKPGVHWHKYSACTQANPYTKERNWIVLKQRKWSKLKWAARCTNVPLHLLRVLISVALVLFTKSTKTNWLTGSIYVCTVFGMISCAMPSSGTRIERNNEK